MIRTPPFNRAFLLMTLLVSAMLVSWEMYCRSKGFVATMDDDKYLWAEKRHLVRDNDPSQVLIIGASRAHFDFQLDVWEQLTGVRPIQLAADGKSGAPVLSDIIRNTQFNGTIVMNITEGLFFNFPHDSIGGYRRAKEWVDFYNNRTWSQRLNHTLSYAIQPYFAFLTTGEDDDPDLKSMVSAIPLRGRLQDPYPPFPRFSYVDANRNTTMLSKMETDTSFQKTIRRVWVDPKDTPKRNDKMIESSFPFYLDLVRTLKARGGKIIWTRNPSHGDVKQIEDIKYPRAAYWDAFTQQSQCPSYHFEDYPALNQFFTPEWSHLSTPDAKKYTRELIGILQSDGHL